jgi:hypothetical protein
MNAVAAVRPRTKRGLKLSRTLGISYDQSAWQKPAGMSQSRASTARTKRGVLKPFPTLASATINPRRGRNSRKAGQLLRDMEMAKPGGDMTKPKEHRSSRPTDAPKTLSDLGISMDQSSTWQKLAAVPDRVMPREANGVDPPDRLLEITGRSDRPVSAAPGTDRGTTRSSESTTPRLADLGISHNQSSTWQKLAAVPDDLFEAELAGHNGLSGQGIVRRTGRRASRHLN